MIFFPRGQTPTSNFRLGGKKIFAGGTWTLLQRTFGGPIHKTILVHSPQIRVDPRWTNVAEQIAGLATSIRRRLRRRYHVKFINFFTNVNPWKTSDITATNYPVVSGSTATVTCVASNVIGWVILQFFIRYLVSSFRFRWHHNLNVKLLFYQRFKENLCVLIYQWCRNAAPASATITLNGVANTQVTHTGNTVTSEITVTQDTTYTCTFTWTGAATDSASSSAVSTSVIADVVGMSFLLMFVALLQYLLAAFLLQHLSLLLIHDHSQLYKK